LNPSWGSLEVALPEDYCARYKGALEVSRQH